jgi:hypothetical protein
MTKEQLDTIRALHAQGYGIFGTDLRALLDEVERLTAEVERLRADPLPAAAWVREVQQAAFARGAEAMREAAAQLVIREVEGWMQLGLSGDIRALPVHENKP